MISISKRILVLVVLVSLLFSSVPKFNDDQNAVSASSPLNTVKSPSSSINTSSDATLLINEVMFNPSAGNYEWVELKNIGPGSIDISGYSLTDEDDNWYEIPDALPPVPEGAFVVVVFDGLGSSENDYDFTDNAAYLHSQAGLVHIFEDDSDQVSLYAKTHNVFLPLISVNNSSIINQSNEVNSSLFVFSYYPVFIKAFVAWGADPEEDGINAVKTGLWFSADFLHYSSIGNDYNTPIYENETIGLLPVFSNSFSTNWTIYIDNSESQGLDNPVPIIKARFVYGESYLDSNTFAIYWEFVNNAIGYKFQLDDENNFSSPLYDLVLDSPAFYASNPVPEGHYYWRVKVMFPDSKESAWSSAFDVYSSNQGDILVSGILNIRWQLQRKDTNMLCLFGGKEAGAEPWDAEHLPAIGVKQHGKNYCSRATISMIASFYGAELSQDRIAFEDFKDKQYVYGDKYICNYDSCNELGHGLWNDYYMNELFNLVRITGITSYTGSKGFNEVKDLIDSFRPLALRLEWAGRYDQGHFLVLDGYKIEEKDDQIIQKVHLLDPYVGEIWLRYDGFIQYITHTYITPSYTPIDILIDDEDGDGTPDTIEDSDGDGICNFDENHRFFTNPNLVDTDGDGVHDKQDLREYVFDKDGNWYLRQADWSDPDSFRKELDWDNDNDGSWDGYEDFNHNGIYEESLGESDNFSASSTRPFGYTRVFFDDFSTDPNSNGQWDVIRLHPEDTTNEASWDSESRVLYLTRTITNRGVAVFANYELTRKNWEAHFRYKVGGGGGDGFVFNFYKDKSSYGLPGCGGSLGFQIGTSLINCIPTTEISGYGIEFDNFGNNYYDNISDPSSNHIALIKDRVANHIVYVDDGRTEDNQWHNVAISFNYGFVSVNLDGQNILSFTISNPDYSFSGVGFSAGTGGSVNNHIIDDFSLFVSN